jgi:hypothetical protein
MLQDIGTDFGAFTSRRKLGTHIANSKLNTKTQFIPLFNWE